MTAIFICETHQPDGRVEAYQSTVRQLTHYVAENLDHENKLWSVGSLSHQDKLSAQVEDVMRLTMQSLIIEYDFKEFFIRCKERAETYGAFFKALDAHKFQDDPYNVEWSSPTLIAASYFGTPEPWDEPQLDISIFDDGRSASLSDLLATEASYTSLGDTEFYGDFATYLEPLIDQTIELMADYEADSPEHLDDGRVISFDANSGTWNGWTNKQSAFFERATP